MAEPTPQRRLEPSAHPCPARSTPSPAEVLRSRLLPRVKRRLERVLPTRLRQASVASVCALILGRLQFGELADAALRELLAEIPTSGAEGDAWLEARAVAIADRAAAQRYVQDCEDVGRYRAAGTTEEERSALRERWLSEHLELLGFEVRSQFFKRGIPEPVASDLEQAQDFTVDAVFGEQNLERTLERYDPAKGREFANFLEQNIRWRASDALERLFRHSVPTQAVEPEVLAAVEAPSESHAGRSWRIQTALQKVLGHVETGNQGAEKRAVVELRFKTYIAPDLFAAATQERVVEHDPAGLPRVETEYHEAQTELKLLLEELEAAHGEVLAAYMRAGRCQGYLEEAGVGRVAIRRLRWEGVHLRSIGDLEAAQRALPSGGPKVRWLELEFMLACHRLEKARRAREVTLERWVKFTGFRLPWVRSQPQIESLIGLDQVAVSHRLAAALDDLRAALRQLPSDWREEEVEAEA